MDEVIVLLRSKLKRAILSAILDGPKTPVMLAKLLKKHRSSISREICKLETIGFVKCLNPEHDRWRRYEITVKGKKTLNEIKKFL